MVCVISFSQNLVSIEECIADPDRAFCRGILEPLTFLAQHDRIASSMPCVILIDALGEAEYHRLIFCTCKCQMHI